MGPFQLKISCNSIILWFKVINRRAHVIVIDYSQHDEEKQLFIAFITFQGAYSPSAAVLPNAREVYSLHVTLWLNPCDFTPLHPRCFPDLLNKGISAFSGGISRFSFVFLHSFIVIFFLFAALFLVGREQFHTQTATARGPENTTLFWDTQFQRPHTLGTGICPLKTNINSLDGPSPTCTPFAFPSIF